MREIARRHDILHTVFDWIDGEPAQVVEPFKPFRLPVKDLRGVSHHEREVEARELVI